MPSFRKYFTNTSWLLAGNIFSGVVVFVVGVYVVRYLGPDKFGLLSYATSFAGLFLPITILGMDEIVIRELVRDESRRDELLGTAFFLKLAGAFFALAVLYAIVHLTSTDSFTSLLIFIIALSAVFQSFNVIDFYLQSKVLSKYVVYANAASLMVSSFVKLFLVWIQAPLLYFAVVSLMESMILATGLLIVYGRQRLNMFEWKFRIKSAVALLRDSWPLMLAGLAISIYLRIDQVMIKQMLDAEAVGQYAAAVKLSEACYFIPVIVCGSLFPAIINAKKQSEELYNARLQKLYSLMLWIAIPITAVMTLFASNIIRFLYGMEFSKAGPVLAIYSWASIFVFLGVASSKWYLVENLQFFSFINSVIGAVVNIVLNLILIKKYGIVGAAWATVISYGCAAYLLNFAYPKTRSNFYRLSRTFNILRVVRVLKRGIYE